MSHSQNYRRFPAALLLFSTTVLLAQNPGPKIDDRNFSGSWILKVEKSELNTLPQKPDALVKIDQKDAMIHWFQLGREPARETWTYRIDGTSFRHKDGDTSLNSQAKWEGSALLINTIVTTPRDSFTVADRWKLSRDGNRLTIVRHVSRGSSDAESTLVYERDGFVPPATLVARAEAKPAAKPEEISPAAPSAPQDYVVQTGTHLPLRLLNSVSTKHSNPGDRIYLQTIYPISAQGRIVIPAGSYVTGSLTEVKRAGRVKGKSELYLRFDSLTLPNGTTRDFRARISGMDDNGKGSLDRSEEGKVQGESGKGSDAKTVATTTAAGAGIGAMAGSAAGHLGMGAGIGAAAGALGGLAGVLMTRGPDAVLDKGSTVEMVLDRDLTFTHEELANHRDR
jgi:type IV secretion system protein VirB10